MEPVASSAVVEKKRRSSRNVQNKPRRVKKKADREKPPERTELVSGEAPDWLPSPWVIERRRRLHGKSKGQIDKYFVNVTTHKRCRSWKELKKHLKIEGMENCETWWQFKKLMNIVEEKKPRKNKANNNATSDAGPSGAQSSEPTKKRSRPRKLEVQAGMPVPRGGGRPKKPRLEQKLRETMADPACNDEHQAPGTTIADGVPSQAPNEAPPQASAEVPPETSEAPAENNPAPPAAREDGGSSQMEKSADAEEPKEGDLYL